jgi:hypothetical protein
MGAFVKTFSIIFFFFHIMDESLENIAVNGENSFW